MNDSKVVGQPRLRGLLKRVQRYQLLIACVVIVLCFALGNDMYRAKALVMKNRDLLPGQKRAVNYEDAVRRHAIRSLFGSDLKRRYLVDPRAKQQKTMLSALAGGSDKCADSLAFFPNPLITALPFDDSGTTVGKTDDYDLTGDATGCPSCVANSGTPGNPGDPPPHYDDRGVAYDGTGTGPDVAYRINFGAASNNMVITLTPTDADPNADDMALILYGSACSGNPADAIVLADNNYPNSGAVPPDNTETITVTNVPAGQYNIVIDGYTSVGAASPTSGPYQLHVDCLVAGCPQPLPIPGRRGGV